MYYSASLLADTPQDPALVWLLLSFSLPPSTHYFFKHSHILQWLLFFTLVSGIWLATEPKLSGLIGGTAVFPGVWVMPGCPTALDWVTLWLRDLPKITQLEMALPEGRDIRAGQRVQSQVLRRKDAGSHGECPGLRVASLLWAWLWTAPGRTNHHAFQGPGLLIWKPAGQPIGGREILNGSKLPSNFGFSNYFII